MNPFVDFAPGTSPDVVPGTVPAWALVFRDGDRKLRTIGSDAYVGAVDAKLPTGLAGGSYEIVVEGMTAEDFQVINSAGSSLTASLHLWWKDAPTGVLGGLARFTGLDNPLAATTPDPPDGSLVAKLGVDRLWRRPGQRRVEVVVTARELAFARLDRQRVDGRCVKSRDPARSGLALAIAKVTEDAAPVVGHRLEDARPGTGKDDYADIPAGSALDALKVLTKQVRDALAIGGLPIVMIRDGKLHIGEWTARNTFTPPLDVPRAIDDHTGLLAIERGADLDREDRAPEGFFPKKPPRRTFAVTALGRPDLKPGDQVAIVLPPEDFTVSQPPSIGATLLTSVPNLEPGAVDPDARPDICRVVEVSHQISREKGFLTTFRAVVLTGGDDGWDRDDPAAPAVDRPPARLAGVPFTGSARGAASTIHAAIEDVTGRALRATRTRPGVVHAHDVADHSSEVWSADTAPDGLPRSAVRARITEQVHAEHVRVPHLTPFAWGSYGMVLPRYPGTSVVLANVGGGSGDLVDFGAVWTDGTGPSARPGDYWLALPVKIAEREFLRDPGKSLPDDGPATHDLIDGDGTRVIETARFVLRVTDRLTKVPDRPEPDDGLGDGSVLIESRAGDGAARIVLKADGSVSITAKSITFDAEDQIDLNAKNVRVKLDGGTMDVS